MKDKIQLIGKNTPSSKNGKIKTKWGVMKSKLCQDYEKWCSPLLKEQLPIWNRMIKDKEPPYHVYFHFKRDSRRRWDFVNIVQIVADMMVKEGYIEDDDTKHFIPIYDGEEVVKKEESGVEFWIN